MDILAQFHEHASAYVGDAAPRDARGGHGCALTDSIFTASGARYYLTPPVHS